MKKHSKSKISVLGTGIWGTSLAALLQNNGHEVTLWGRNGVFLKTLQSSQSHPHLPSSPLISLPKTLSFTLSLEKALTSADYVVTAISVQAYHDFLPQIKTFLKPSSVLINTSKGIDVRNSLLVSELVKKHLPDFPHEHYAVLSGPSYAQEVFKQIPTAIVLASAKKEIAEKVQALFCNEWFRVYTNSDVRGVEWAGAVKNIIAIASGICQGIGYGFNTQAALITRGNAEILRLGKLMGSNPKTFQGLAGMGDLMMTALSPMSRNYSFGLSVGQGLTREEALSKIEGVVEGLETIQATRKLAKTHHIEMPIIEKVFEILFKGKSAKQAVNELMGRKPKSE